MEQGLERTITEESDVFILAGIDTKEQKGHRLREERLRWMPLVKLCVAYFR